MPIVSCTLRAALKEVLAGMKRFVLVVVDLLWELGRMATNRAFEGYYSILSHITVLFKVSNSFHI